MGRKKSEVVSEEEVQSDEEMEVKVEKAIKELPTLEEKVQAIAINQYLIQKRALDKEVAAEITKIQVKHRNTFEPYLEEIFNIVAGKVDLTDADLEGVDHLLTDLEKSTKNNYYGRNPLEDYWQKALMSHDCIMESIQPDDEKPLTHLIKIEASKTEDGKCLALIFHFSDNEYFSNSTIKKEFELEGDEIKRSFGSEIEWKEGKNLTVEIVKKKNKKKKTTSTKKVKKESFFNIFNDIDLTSDTEEDKDKDKEQADDEDEDADVQQMERQYEICNYLYEDLIPKSLQYYLGVMPGFGGEEELNGLLGAQAIEEGDEDEDSEEEQKPKKKQKNKRKASNSSKQ